MSIEAILKKNSSDSASTIVVMNGAGHHRWVEPQPLGQNRQRRAHQLGHQHGHGQRQADDQRHTKAHPIEQQ